MKYKNIFYIIIAITFSFNASSAEKDVLDDINKMLIEKKKNLEPFNDKDVKIDIESLGLDNVNEELKKELKQEASPVINPLPAVTKEEENKNSKNIKLEKNLDDKISKTNLLIQDKEKSNQLTNDANKKLSSNSTNKKGLKKSKYSKRVQEEINKKEKEKIQREIERKEKSISNKIKELRRKYLFESDNSSTSQLDYNEDSDSYSEKLIPRKKDLNPYKLEELPAYPILQRYRSNENYHIPFEMTPKEKIDIMFNAISIGSVSFFNDAYKNVNNPNIYNDNGESILTYSILLKKYPVVASVLSKGADPNLPNSLGYTPLQIAIELQDFKAFELLINNNVDINYTDAFGRNYLMHIARIGFLPALDMLVKKGANVNHTDNDGFTPLSVAYRFKNEMVVQYLLKNGAKTWTEKEFNYEKKSLIEELKNRWK